MSIGFNDGKQIFDKYGNYNFPTDIKQKGLNVATSQIEEMAKVIRPVLENRTDIGFVPDLDRPIAKELLKHYQPKLPANSVVLSREEYEKSFDIKVYNKVLEENRLLKKQNDRLLQQLIKERKATAERILDEIYEVLWDEKVPIAIRFVNLDVEIREIATREGVEIKE